MLIFDRRQLEAVLVESVDHYNTHRPHRSRDQAAPLSMHPTPPLASPPDANRLRRSGSGVSSTSTNWLHEAFG
jgi:hypothetical protein